jgi:predicted nucleic acid-binding protein
LASTVVADAGPLIAFAKIWRLDLLPAVLGRVVMPDVVAVECMGNLSRADEKEIESALSNGLLDLVLTKDLSSNPLTDSLDPGESAAIRLALTLDRETLIDEKEGRDVARQLGLRVRGSLGVLTQAKRQGLTLAVKPLIEQMWQARYFFADELMQKSCGQTASKTILLTPHISPVPRFGFGGQARFAIRSHIRDSRDSGSIHVVSYNKEARTLRIGVFITQQPKGRRYSRHEKA